MVHAQVILIACIPWLFQFLKRLLLAPREQVLALNVFLEAGVFIYGLLIYRAWLTLRPSVWLRPLFFWLPQILFVNLYPPDHDSSPVGDPTTSFSAKLALDMSVILGWQFSDKVVKIGVNFVALVGTITSLLTDHRWYPAPPGVAAGQPLSRVRRAVAILIFTVPIFAVMLTLFGRLTSNHIELKGPPPADLEQVVLRSGKVIRVRSIGQIQQQRNEPILALDYVSALIPSGIMPPEKEMELDEEAAQVWEHFRPLVEAAGMRSALIRASQDPKGILGATRRKGYLWHRDDEGAWQRSNGPKPPP